MFDTTVELIGASVAPIEVGSGEEGALELSFVSGLTLPVQGPDGNPLRIPSGQYKFRLSKSQALEFFTKVKETADDLPKGSGIVIADEKTADQMAKTIEEIKKDG
jgi:hypothetical protein